MGVKEAAGLVHAAGGISSLAHPKFLDDQSLVPTLLRSGGVRAVEAYHADHSAEERTRYLGIADSLKLLVTGGSDFHERGEERKRFGSDLPFERYQELRAALPSRG